MVHELQCICFGFMKVSSQPNLSVIQGGLGFSNLGCSGLKICLKNRIIQER